MKTPKKNTNENKKEINKFYIKDIINLIINKIYDKKSEAIILSSEEKENVDIIPILPKHIEKLLNEILKKQLVAAIKDIVKSINKEDSLKQTQLKVYKFLTINIYPPKEKVYFNPSTEKKQTSIISRVSSSLSKSFVNGLREIINNKKI